MPPASLYVVITYPSGVISFEIISGPGSCLSAAGESRGITVMAGCRLSDNFDRARGRTSAGKTEEGIRRGGGSDDDEDNERRFLTC